MFETIVPSFLFLIFGAIGAAIVYRLLFATVVIYEYQKGLLFKNGKFKTYYLAGKHIFFRYGKEIKKVDIRPRLLSVKGQEIPSSDGVALKISLIAQYNIEDPLAATNNIESYEEAVYASLQTALREVVGGYNVDDLLENRNDIGEKLMGLVKDKVAVFGINLASVDVKDIIFPGELKNIFAQIVKAKKDALATLERARGETAALRNLANAAKMAETNPNLMQLRALQMLTEQTGNTIVFGVGAEGPILPTVKDES
jgi:regulator of protease activity HflC (stomatin/prohibitin superfamily)